MKKAFKLKQFDLQNFVEASLAFNKSMINPEISPTDIVQELQGDSGRVRDIEENESRDLESDLLKNKKRLFFPFSNIGLLDEIDCADGQTYEIDEDSDFSLGETGQAGFVVGVDGDEICLESAALCGGSCMGPPSVEKCSCDVFDQPMADFIEGFVQ